MARRSPGAAEKDCRPMKASLLPIVLAAGLMACAPASEAPAPAATAELAEEVPVVDPEVAGIAMRNAGRELTIPLIPARYGGKWYTDLQRINFERSAFPASVPTFSST
jgi:hypothetical protein